MQWRDVVIIGFGLAWGCGWARPAVGQAALAVNTQPVRTPHVVLVADDVLKDLARLAAGAKRETVRCLIGVLQGDTAYIDIAWRPRIHHSSPSHVRYGGCPLATIAKWHNHLARFAPTPLEACYLSDIDVEDALVPGAPPLQVVQVNAGVMCWWTKGQVQTAPAAALLEPLEGQLTGSPPPPPPPSPQASTTPHGPQARSP